MKTSFDEILFEKALEIYSQIFGEKNNYGTYTNKGDLHNDNLWGRLQVLEEIFDENDMRNAWNSYLNRFYHHL